MPTSMQIEHVIDLRTAISGVYRLPYSLNMADNFYEVLPILESAGPSPSGVQHKLSGEDV